jgi:hypothetical protein
MVRRVFDKFLSQNLGRSLGCAQDVILSKIG